MNRLVSAPAAAIRWVSYAESLDVSSAGVKDTSAPAVGIEQGALRQFLFEALARSFLGRADRAPHEVDEAIALDSFRPSRGNTKARRHRKRYGTPQMAAAAGLLDNALRGRGRLCRLFRPLQMTTRRRAACDADSDGGGGWPKLRPTPPRPSKQRLFLHFESATGRPTSRIASRIVGAYSPPHGERGKSTRVEL